LNKEKQSRKSLSKNNGQSEPSKVSLILKEGALIGWLVICVYLLVALVTNSPDDPAWSHVGNVDHIINAGGFIGAWLSDIFFSFLGYVAFLLPALLALRAWNVYKTRQFSFHSSHTRASDGAS